MKHKIIGNKVSLGNREWSIKVKLIPKDEYERKIIKNYELSNVTEEEHKLVDDYLIEVVNNLGYSPVSSLDTILGNSIFKLSYIS